MLVTANGLEVSIQGPKKRERLAIKSPYPIDTYALNLFASLGAMHLVAPYFPDSIVMNWTMPEQIIVLLEKMYEYHGKELSCTDRPIDVPENFFPLPADKIRAVSDTKAVVAYSAGKDSMWNLWWALERYGPDNVLVVHTRGLNRNNGSNELKWTLKQQKKFGFKHLHVIELLNASENTGYATMVSRDMFLTGIMVPLAVDFGAAHIITEGFAEEAELEPFTGHAPNMVYFNKVLKDLGLPVQVIWRDRAEMDIVKDLYEHKPEWMPYVCNCFTIPCRQPNFARLFAKRCPSIKLYKSQCGSCVKCRIIILGRLLYGRRPWEVFRVNDVRAFLKNTDQWMRATDEHHTDMLTPSFMRDYAQACKMYLYHPRHKTA